MVFWGHVQIQVKCGFVTQRWSSFYPMMCEQARRSLPQHDWRTCLKGHRPVYKPPAPCIGESLLVWCFSCTSNNWICYVSHYWYGIVFKQSALKTHGPSFNFHWNSLVRGIPYFQRYPHRSKQFMVCPPANPAHFAPSPMKMQCFVPSSSGSPLKRHL